MSVNFKTHKENGILIKPYYGNYHNDKALMNLEKILIEVAEDNNIQDVREGIKKYKNEIMKNVTSSSGW